MDVGLKRFEAALDVFAFRVAAFAFLFFVAPATITTASPTRACAAMQG